MATRHPTAEEVLAELEAEPPPAPNEPPSPELLAFLEERVEDSIAHPERLIPHEQVRERGMAIVREAARRQRMR